jgi:hypothetical protein
MQYDLLKGCDAAPLPNRSFFLFAAKPALNDVLLDQCTEALNLFPIYYDDSSEFSFDQEQLRDEAIDSVKTLLESEGHTVRLLAREVEVGADAESNTSLFEESTILH